MNVDETNSTSLKQVESNKDFLDNSNAICDTDPLIESINKQNDNNDNSANKNLKNLPDLSLNKHNTITPTVTPATTTPIATNTVVNDNDDTTSSLTGSNNAIMCRICHCEETSEEYLITPCFCTGTLRFVHQSCLQQWLKSTGTKSCELCKFEFIMQTKIRPFKYWEKLDMNNIERRKILCSVTFHVIAITCVIWSLYVLIERTADEIKSNNFDWAFWIKLIVVAIGFTGGCVFMYIQCKMYFQLCLRWRQYNRVIIIQPITEEILKNSKKKLNEKNNFLFSSKNNSTKTNNSKIHDETSSAFVTINANLIHSNQITGTDTILCLPNNGHAE